MNITKKAKEVVHQIEQLSPGEIQFIINELYHKLNWKDYLKLIMDATSERDNVSPKTLRDNPIAVKSLGQLIDELSIINIRIWMLIDKVMAGVATTEEAKDVQEYNGMRNQYVRAIDAILSEKKVAAKTYEI